MCIILTPNGEDIQVADFVNEPLKDVKIISSYKFFQNDESEDPSSDSDTQACLKELAFFKYYLNNNGYLKTYTNFVLNSW